MAGVKRGRVNLAARELLLPPPSRVVSNSLPLPFRTPPTQARIRARTRARTRARGPFLESPAKFSGPKSNIQIEIQTKRAWVLASKLLHFVSLTDSFIMLDAKLLKPRSLM